MPQGGRKHHLQAVHEISGQYGPANSDGIGGVLGVIPRGAILGSIHVVVSQAFNSTTNTLNIGTSPQGGQIVTNLDLKTVARTDTPIVIGLAQPGADFPIYFTLSSTGAAPTAGLVTAWIDYCPGAG